MDVGEEIQIVTFKWRDPSYRAQYTSQHVNILARMIARNYRARHRVVCYTDDARGLDSAIEARPLWNDLAAVPNPTGGGRPSCYRRLKLFAPEIQEQLSERFIMMDLDCVITGDLIPLWQRYERLAFYRCPHPNAKWLYNGGMWICSRGCAPELWADFDPQVHPQEAQAKGFHGSDQGWINLRMPPTLPTFGEEAGARRITPYLRGKRLPRDTRVVFCFGDKPPWALRHLAWVREHYQ